MVKKIGIKLDMKDKKILFELDFDARQSNSAIARKVGLSKQGVDYRIRRLERKGLVRGFYPVINVIRLGYVYGRLFIKLQNLTREKEKQIYSAIVGDPFFKWVLVAEGSYEVLAASWPSNLSGFKAISGQVLESFGQYIKEKKESVGLRVMHFQSRYLLGTSATREVSVEEGPLFSADEVDRALLRALCRNARMPIVEMARQGKISAKVAAYRLRRLEKEGIVLAYRPDINHNLLGFTHYKIFLFLANATKDVLRKFRFYLRQLHQIIYVIDEIGICDIDIEVMLPSTQSLFSFIDQIKFDFPTLIKDYQIIIVKRTLKINYMPFD